MTENRKCVNCRHNIRKEKPSANIECVCEITNSHIGYVKCFEGWCRHWAKQKDGKEAEFIVVDEFNRMEQTALKGKQDVWLRNLTSLKMGEFGIDTKSPKTLLAYWKSQALAGYPSADENVRYFEEMVRKEIGRQFIGFEISKKWCKVANDRLNNIDANGQISLFPR